MGTLRHIISSDCPLLVTGLEGTEAMEEVDLMAEAREDMEEAKGVMEVVDRGGMVRVEDTASTELSGEDEVLYVTKQPN